MRSLYFLLFLLYSVYAKVDTVVHHCPTKAINFGDNSFFDLCLPLECRNYIVAGNNPFLELNVYPDYTPYEVRFYFYFNPEGRQHLIIHTYGSAFGGMLFGGDCVALSCVGSSCDFISCDGRNYYDGYSMY